MKRVFEPCPSHLIKRSSRVNFLSCHAFASTADIAHAYTLSVTSCADEWSHTVDTDITFHFCEGGSYCDSEEFVTELPVGATITDGGTLGIPVSPGFEPTTLDIKKGSAGDDSW